MGTVAQRWTQRARRLVGTSALRAIRFVSVRLGRLTPAVQTRVVRMAQLALEVHTKSDQDEVGVHAAALTYNCFLSMLPLTLVGLSLSGFLLHAGQTVTWADRVARSIPGLSALTHRDLSSLQRSRGGLGAAGLIGALWVGSTLTSRAQKALDKVFGGKESALANRLRAVAVSIVLGAILLSLAAATGYIANLSAAGLIALPLDVAIQIAIAVLLFAYWLTAYWMLTPAKGVRLRDHLTGALWMTIGFEILRLAGGWYVGRFVARASVLYGAIGGVFGLLIFIRLSMWLFLSGAEVSSVLRTALPWESLKTDLRSHSLESLDSESEEVVDG